MTEKEGEIIFTKRMKPYKLEYKVGYPDYEVAIEYFSSKKHRRKRIRILRKLSDVWDIRKIKFGD